MKNTANIKGGDMNDQAFSFGVGRRRAPCHKRKVHERKEIYARGFLNAAPEMAQEVSMRKLGMVTLAGILATLIFYGVVIGVAGADEIQASWYSVDSLKKEGTWKNGKEQRMANGDRFSDNGLTCASRMFPLGAKLDITNLRNGRSVQVVVTDRIGKRFAKTRIDLSKAAFKRIADLKEGVVKVRIKRIKGGSNC